MDWQTSTTILILAIAAGILLKRLTAFFRTGKTGSCGSCAKCGDSANESPPLLLVPLGTGQSQPNDHRPSDAGTGKTG